MELTPTEPPPIESAPDAKPPRTLWQAVPAWPALVNFQVFNSIAFQIATGPPLVLMVQKWGASQTYIGLITCLLPLLATLQIILAPRIEYIGFRKVMLSGWTARNVMLLLMALLPWAGAALGKQHYPLLLFILYILMTIYNLLRGLVSASWMPWVTYLVPQEWRGRYTSLEQLIINLSYTGTFITCGLVLSKNPSDLRFGLLYIIAVVAGASSLFFLKNIDSPPPLEGRPRHGPMHVWIPLVWAERALRRLIRVSVVFNLSVAAWVTFTTVFMREVMHIDDGHILFMNSAQVLGIVMSSYLWGILSDRFGSVPIMALATRVLLVSMTGWMLVALHLIPGGRNVYYGLYLLHGLGIVGFTIGNTRYCLNSAPKVAPVLGLTLYSVFANLSLALAPALWGRLLDWMGELNVAVGPLHLDRFAVFYGVSLLLIIFTKVLIHRLPGERSGHTNTVLYYLVADYPLRTLGGLYKTIFPRGK